MCKEGTGAVNIDLTGIVNKLSDIETVLSGDEKTFIKDLVVRLYSSINFESNSKSPYQIAQDCLTRAITLVDVLKKQKILD